MPHRPHGTNRRTLFVTLIAGACVGASSTTVVASSAETNAGSGDRRAGVQPELAGGFDSIAFAINPIRGAIDASANAGWLWREGSTHRLQLMGDVEMVLGDSYFSARSATLWLRKIGENEGREQYQIYAVFEDMRSADGTITMQAQRLPVRGVIELNHPISIALDARFNQPPEPDTRAGHYRNQGERVYAQRVLGQGVVRGEEPPQRPWSSPSDAPAIAEGSAQPGVEPAIITNPSAPVPNGPVFDDDGVFSVSIGGNVVIDGIRDGSQSVITADGGVRVQYLSPSSGRWVDFSAERVVIYTRGDEPVSGVTQLGTGQIEGIYLEGGVFAGDDQWSVRSPRMYLDVANNKALMLDTVFWTTDRQSSMPLYLRAASVRQTARDEFLAENATISNTAFFEPDVTIGIKDIRVTLGQDSVTRRDIDPRPDVRVEAKRVVLKAGPVPLLWLPGYKGNPGDFPLRQVKIGDSGQNGFEFQTRWNALSLFGIEAPPGVDVDLDLDYYGERGIAFGIQSDWSTAKHRGGILSYLVPDDSGTDETAPGIDISRENETRGMFALHDIWQVTNQWTLITEASYFSDETFVPAFYDNLGRSTEAFRNRLQLERLSDTSLLTFEISGVVNDFIVPEHQLQSPGYSVYKTPEARFVTLGRDLLGDIEPGLLTYNFEARAGVMRLAFSEVEARDYGFVTDSLADDAFGTTATQSLGDVFRAQGLDEGAVTRLDSRLELNSQLNLGPIRVNPFLVGRVTAYDDDFAAYSPAQTDDTRYWGAAGVTFSTTISKVDDSVESRLLDLHRIRHIIEPSITIWGSDSGFDRGDVPVYDDDVEDLLVGSAFRAAIDQTWQTKRGGVGRWRDVDLIRWRVEYNNIDDDTGSDPIPEYFSSRPELSSAGETFATSMIVQPTDAFALAGEWVYDLDTNNVVRSSVGMILENRPGLTTTIEYRDVQPLDATFLTMGVGYRMSDKYAVYINGDYNFTVDDFQTFNTQILRRFQVGTIGATIQYDNIRDDTSFGFVFRPLGSSNDLPIDQSWGG